MEPVSPATNNSTWVGHEAGRLCGGYRSRLKAGTTTWVGLAPYPTNPFIGFTALLSGNTFSASTFSASPN